jgi:hypothetical protein
MRKEVSFAVIIGIILGGAILFGINLANQSTSNLPKSPVPQIITPTLAQENSPSEVKDQKSEILIPSFSDNDVVFETPLILAGTAVPNTSIALVTNEDDILTKTDASGIFTSEINLVSGLNTITISQPQDGTLANGAPSLLLSKTNRMIKKKLLISIFCFCLSAFGGSLPKNVLAATSTPSGTVDVNKIKTIVQENLAATEKALTDQNTKLTGRTGTIKSIGAKNLTLEIDKDITQVNLSNSNTKPSSLAIGNKITILGYLTKDDVLDAKLVSPVTEEKVEDQVTTESLIAVISKIDLKKKSFVLTLNKSELSYTLSKKNTVKLEDFKDGDTIFGISKKYQGKLSLSKAIKL